MKQTVFGLLVLIVTTTAANAQPINVMSWNIRYDNPNDGVNGWPNRKDWVAEIVTNNKIDLAGFQEVLVRSLRQRFADVPVVLTGDLNTGLNSPPYRMLVTAGEQGERSFLDTFDHSEQKPVGPDSTWNGFKEIVPGQRIDFVMTTSTVRTLSFQILTDRRGDRFPSDHLPVVTRLELIKK